MKSKIVFAALLGFAFTALASNASAQSGAPGAAAPRGNKVTAVPPPPGRGPDRLSIPTTPSAPNDLIALPRVPKSFDKFAGQPGEPQADHGGSTCYPAAGPNCVASLDKVCTKNGGGMVTNDDGTVTCIMPN